jgi:hypothetical protein
MQNLVYIFINYLNVFLTHKMSFIYAAYIFMNYSIIRNVLFIGYQLLYLNYFISIPTTPSACHEADALTPTSPPSICSLHIT